MYCLDLGYVSLIHPITHPCYPDLPQEMKVKYESIPEGEKNDAQKQFLCP